MRIGICEWTTFPASFEDELAAYRAAGAGAIGILEFKLDGVDDVRGKLRESGLAASACLPAAGSILPSPLIPGPDEPEARVESICASVERFAELEPSCVLLPDRARRRRHRATVVEGIRRIAEAGARHGVRVALEPIHPSQAAVLSFVHTIDEALELIGGAEVGILFDTWHLDEVSHVDRIHGVHVADRVEPTRSRTSTGRSRARARRRRAGARRGGLRRLVRRRGDVRRRDVRKRVPGLAVGPADRTSSRAARSRAWRRS